MGEIISLIFPTQMVTIFKSYDREFYAVEFYAFLGPVKETTVFLVSRS